MTEQLISFSLVAKKLRFHPKSLQQWHRDNILEIVWQGNAKCYRESDINVLLQQGARNFEQAPTWHDVATGHVVFLIATEAASQLRVSTAEAGRRTKRGTLSAVMFG